eukprot:ctg_826.g178
MARRRLHPGVTRRLFVSGNARRRCRASPGESAGERHVVCGPPHRCRRRRHRRRRRPMPRQRPPLDPMGRRLRDVPTSPAAAPRRPRRHRRTAVSGLAGLGTGARHHRQVAGGTYELCGSGRTAVRAELDRHARSRRFCVRGVPFAAGVRGRAAVGGRHQGRRGADAGQRLPGHREQPGDCAGAEQDRSAGGEPRYGRRGRAERDRAGHVQRRAHLRQNGHRHRGDAGGGGALRAAAGCLWRRQAVAGADFRQRLRRVSRCGGVLPGGGRAGVPRRSHPFHGQRQGVCGGRAGRALAQTAVGRRVGRGRGRLPAGQHQDRGRCARGRHHHHGAHAGHHAAAGLQGGEADGVQRGVSGQRRSVRAAERRAGETQVERRGAAVRERELAGARLWVSLRFPGSAAPGCGDRTVGERVRPATDHHGALGVVSRAHHQGRGAHHRQPDAPAAAHPHRAHRGAVHAHRNGDAGGVCRPADGAGAASARRIPRHALPGGSSDGVGVRDAAVGDGERLFRPAQIAQQGLRRPRLPIGGLSHEPAGEIGRCHSRRGGRRHERDLSPRLGAGDRSQSVYAPAGYDPATAVQGGDSGAHRRQGDCRGASERVTERCDRQVVRRGCHAEEEAAGEAEAREEVGRGASIEQRDTGAGRGVSGDSDRQARRVREMRVCWSLAVDV